MGTSLHTFLETCVQKIVHLVQVLRVVQFLQGQWIAYPICILWSQSCVFPIGAAAHNHLSLLYRWLTYGHQIIWPTGSLGTAPLNGSRLHSPRTHICGVSIMGNHTPKSYDVIANGFGCQICVFRFSGSPHSVSTVNILLMINQSTENHHDISPILIQTPNSCNIGSSFLRRESISSGKSSNIENPVCRSLPRCFPNDLLSFKKQTFATMRRGSLFLEFCSKPMRWHWCICMLGLFFWIIKKIGGGGFFMNIFRFS